MSIPNRKRPFVLALWASCVLGCGASDESQVAKPESSESGEHFLGGDSARISHIRGRAGLHTDDLPEGAFLGEGAELEPGASVSSPVGTQAELSFGDEPGMPTLRLNEATTVRLADDESPTRVEAGELVVAASGDHPVVIAAGEERATLLGGELQVVVAADGQRRFAVLSGSATVESADQTFELVPGASQTFPLPSAQADAVQKPLMSLAPMRETEWAREFERHSAATAQLANAVPRGIGSLTARRAGSRVERQRLRLEDQRVDVSISGTIARTDIEQAFRNETGQVLEGIYRFPLPADASISGLQLLVGDTWVDGEIVEKQRGRQIFQQIVDATIPRDPALLEWERGNIFKLRIFPIPAHGVRKVRLSYTQVLPSVGDALRYRYPMGGSGATDTSIDNFAFSVAVDGAALDPAEQAAIATPMLDLERRERGDVIHFSTSQRDYLPSWDLGIDLPQAADDSAVRSQTYLDRDGQAYFMLTLQPEFVASVATGPKHYAFVLDRSHSMTPELWTLARSLVVANVKSLGDEDRYTVLACDTACDRLEGGMHDPNDPVGALESFLDRQSLGGASDIGGMLTHANEVLGPQTGGVPGVAVYLGDGTATSGALAPDELTEIADRDLGELRIQAVALGARSDLTVLDALVQASGGDLLQADPRDDVGRLVRELRIRSEVPVASGIELELPDGMIDVHPKRLPGLRPGEPLHVVGKLSHPVSGDVVLRSRGGQSERFGVDLRAGEQRTETGAHLPRTWAKEQIEHLTVSQGYGAREDIIALSKNYNVVSRFTSLIVLENDAMFREFNVARKAGRTDDWKGLGNAATTTMGDTAVAAGAPDANRAKDGSVAEDLAKDNSGSRPPSDPYGPPGVPEADAAPPAESVRDEFEQQLANKGDDADADADAWPYDGEYWDDELSYYDDEDGLDSLGAGGVGGNNGGGLGTSRPETKSPKKKSKTKKPTGKNTGANKPIPGSPPGDIPGGVAGGVPGGVTGSVGMDAYGGKKIAKSFPRLRISATRELSRSAQDRIAALVGNRDADDGSRAAHRKLVRAAIAAGHVDAVAFASDWARVDPEHASAMRSHADALLAAGDPMALRAYASEVEVSPYVVRTHRELASAYETVGDLTRSCSHRRAAVSIDPKNGSDAAALVRCLDRLGRAAHARRSAASAQLAVKSDRDALRRAIDELGRQERPVARLHSGADVKVTLTWPAGADLHVALVDGRGRRSTFVRPGKTRVRSSDHKEELTFRRVRKPVYVEVVRLDDGSQPVDATVKVRTPDGTRVFHPTVTRRAVRVAKVRKVR